MVQPEIFFISLNTTFFLTTVLSVPESDRGKWVTDLAIALASNKPTSEYSKRLLEYAKAKSKVNKENGRKGGISKANSSEARKKASEALASALPEVKEEVKREVEVTGEAKEELETKSLEAIPETVEKPVSKPRKKKLTDEEWMNEIQNNPAYNGIDFNKEIGKAQAWCLTKGRECTRAFLLNWFNKAEKPFALTGEKTRLMSYREQVNKAAGDAFVNGDF